MGSHKGSSSVSIASIEKVITKPLITRPPSAKPRLKTFKENTRRSFKDDQASPGNVKKKSEVNNGIDFTVLAELVLEGVRFVERFRFVELVLTWVL
jgi:hypothetical protein